MRSCCIAMRSDSVPRFRPNSLPQFDVGRLGLLLFRQAKIQPPGKRRRQIGVDHRRIVGLRLQQRRPAWRIAATTVAAIAGGRPDRCAGTTGLSRIVVRGFERQFQRLGAAEEEVDGGPRRPVENAPQQPAHLLRAPGRRWSAGVSPSSNSFMSLPKAGLSSGRIQHAAVPSRSGRCPRCPAARAACPAATRR